MSHGILDCLNLFFRTSWLPAVRRLRLIIILTLYDPMLLLNLRDIQISRPISVLLLNPVPYGIIGCTFLKPIRIHILQTEFNPQFLRLDISLGKLNNRLRRSTVCLLFHIFYRLHRLSIYMLKKHHRQYQRHSLCDQEAEPYLVHVPREAGNEPCRGNECDQLSAD